MGQQTKSLAALGLAAQSGRDAQITGLTVDSRNVRDGMLFAALPGAVVHGAKFIQYALRMGASAILTDPKGAEIAAIGRIRCGINHRPRPAPNFGPDRIALVGRTSTYCGCSNGDKRENFGQHIRPSNMGRNGHRRGQSGHHRR